MTRFLPVAARANFSAPSIASVPELQKKTASRCGGVRFVIASARSPLRNEQSICTMLGKSRSRTSRIAFFTPGVDLVETNDTLGRDQGAVDMSMMQLVIFAEPRGNDFFQVKRHSRTFSDLGGKS